MTAKIKKGLLYAILIFLAVICLMPFLLMMVNATRTGSEIVKSFTLVPGHALSVNWAIVSAIADSRVRAIFAWHYLTPEVALMYLGNQGNVDAKIARSR